MDEIKSNKIEVKKSDNGKNKGSFMPNPFPNHSREAEQTKLKIADRIINATGNELKQLNILPTGLFIPMVAMDILDYLVENCGGEISEEHLVGMIRDSLDMRMRAVKGALINKAVILAGDEQRASQQDEYGGSPNFRI